MKAREFYNKRLEENNTIGSVQLMEEYAEQKQNDIDELVEFIKEVKYSTSNEMLYSKSMELIQKHTKK